MSHGNLGCQDSDLPNPVMVVLDGNGAAMPAPSNTTRQRATATNGPAG